MLSFHDRASLRHALTRSLRVDLKDLLHKRIHQILDDGLADLTHLLVIEASDTEAMVREEVAFSPLEVEGVRYGSPGFIHQWDWLEDHGGWFELIFCVGNDGFAFVLLVQDEPGSGWPELRAACRREVGGGGR
ncbi:hypothetical protein [Sphingobium sp. TKS]|uniref:hypothetical protein n=1 Tax=Sphingobium sp. TKS TaxID=1315974 RepID=UPI00076FE5C5|nr:hypothetical protein [Sphingobium sp. TKS]AMK24407.1 hypothetical protein K426_17375 [Sphingobium sp. TKS]